MQTVLVLGGSGRLGSALRTRWDHVVAPPSSELDLRDDDAIARRIDELEPALIVNCAGLTDVDGCERDPQAADELNGYAPGRLARRAARAGVPCVYISTDYVFSGHPERSLAEEDALAPVNRYGQSKARGEGLVLDSGAQALVARVQWLFGGPKPDFVRFVRARLRSGEEVPVIADQIGVPSCTDDLADQLEIACQARLRGVLHLGSSDEVSRQGQAELIAAQLGMEGAWRRVTWRELGRPAERPGRSVLDTSRLRDLVASSGRSADDHLWSWREAQRRYLELIDEEEKT